jgi:hypothetical protein
MKSYLGTYRYVSSARRENKDSYDTQCRRVKKEASQISLKTIAVGAALFGSGSALVGASAAIDVVPVVPGVITGFCFLLMSISILENAVDSVRKAALLRKRDCSDMV